MDEEEYYQYFGNITDDEVLSFDIEQGKSFCEINADISCRRVTLAIVLGAVSATTASICAFWKNAPQLCQSEVAFLLLIAWLVGTILLTFDSGPGKHMGHIYFMTWASLFFSLDILVSTIHASAAPRNHERDEWPEQRQGNDPRELRGSNIFDLAYNRLEITGRSQENTTRSIRRGFSASLFESVQAWRGKPQTEQAPTEPPDGTDAPTESNPCTTQAKRRHKLKRVEMWFVLLIASCVCLAALYTTLFNVDDDQEAESNTGALIAPSVSIALSVFGYIANLVPNSKAAKFVELGLVCTYEIFSAMGIYFSLSTRPYLKSFVTMSSDFVVEFFVCSLLVPWGKRRFHQRRLVHWEFSE
jgi:hypothetical protein